MKESAKVLPEQTGINKHAIELADDKQPSHRPIYNLGLVELKTLKTYIKTNLANHFIQPFKSSIGASIFLFESPIIVYACVSIIEGSITLQSKTNIRYHWLVSS